MWANSEDEFARQKVFIRCDLSAQHNAANCFRPNQPFSQRYYFVRLINQQHSSSINANFVWKAEKRCVRRVAPLSNCNFAFLPLYTPISQIRNIFRNKKPEFNHHFISSRTVRRHLYAIIGHCAQVTPPQH